MNFEDAKDTTYLFLMAEGFSCCNMPYLYSIPIYHVILGIVYFQLHFTMVCEVFIMIIPITFTLDPLVYISRHSRCCKSNHRGLPIPGAVFVWYRTACGYMKCYWWVSGKVAYLDRKAFVVCIYGLAKDRDNCSVSAMGLPQSSTKPFI